MGPIRDALRAGAAAKDPSLGYRFDQANLDDSTFKKSISHGLRRRPVRPRWAVVSRALRYPTRATLRRSRSSLAPDAARATVADVLSRMGQKSGAFTPSKWAEQYSGLTPEITDFIKRTAPEAEPYLNNATIGAGAFDIAPERPGWSKSAGWLATMAKLAMEHPALMATMAPIIETPSVIRSVSGKTDIPALVAQYARRQGLGIGRQ